MRWKQNSSDVFPLDTQGSLLGPFLFSLCIAPLSAVINSFGVSHHQSADDTQIYIAVSRADVSAKVDLLQDCTAGIHSWLQMNGLQLNPIKSEVIQFTATRGRDKVDDVTSVVVSNAIIQPVSIIRHSKPWSHSRPEAVIRPTCEQYLQIELSPHPGFGAYPRVAA